MIINTLHWTAKEPPSEAAIRRILQQEGLQPYCWATEPGVVYAAHSHGYHKVIYVLAGSITFALPDERKSVALRPGDRLELPAGVVHDASVGPDGVVCLEAHRG
jgi:quercetin dioxygenase-like cupin family protein